MMLLAIGMGLFIVFLFYITYKLVWQPNWGSTKGAYVKAATVRGRTIVFDKNDFGKAEVVEGRKLNDSTAIFRLRDGNGVVHRRRYVLANLEPYNIFDLMCGQGSPEVIHKGTRLELDNEERKIVEEIERKEAKAREAEAERRLAKASVEEEKERVVDAVIKLSQAKSSGYMGGSSR